MYHHELAEKIRKTAQSTPPYSPQARMVSTEDLLALANELDPPKKPTLADVLNTEKLYGWTSWVMLGSGARKQGIVISLSPSCIYVAGAGISHAAIHALSDFIKENYE